MCLTVPPTRKTTTQPAREFGIMSESKRITIDGTMTHQNLFATLKYAVKAVPFFDGKNIPLNYFIEGCEEAKSMLSDEAES